MNQRAGDVLKFLLFVGIGFGILYLLYVNQQAAYLEDCGLRGVAAEDCNLLDKIWTDFRGADVGWLLLALGGFCISNLSRAARWNQMLRSMGYTPRLDNAFLTINLGYFANLGFPRLGEIARPAAMARYENIPLEKVIGTVVVERIVDVVMIGLYTLAALFVGRELLWNWIGENAVIGDRLVGLQWLLGSVVALTVGGLALAWWQRRRIAASAVGQKLIGILRGFAEGIKSILEVDRPLVYVLHTFNIWLMYFLMTYFVLLAYVPTAGIGPGPSLVTFVAGGWGIVVPSPGGMGSYHFMTQSALELYGVASQDGFTWANICFFTINIGCNVAIGLLALVVLPRINRGGGAGAGL